MNKKRTVDLIHGPILPRSKLHLSNLAINIFQQLYNTVDVLIVGRFRHNLVGAVFIAIFDPIVGLHLCWQCMGLVAVSLLWGLNYKIISEAVAAT